MPGYYIYLISSLPMLHFGAPLPFSFEKFIQLCQDLISEGDIDILKIVARDKDYIYKGTQSTLKKWHTFERALRNELVKIRVSRIHQDFHKYIRPPDDAEPFISRIALNVSRAPSIIEAERMLDQARWQILDELVVGHYFDMDCLIVYGCKLLILERWDRIRTADKSRILEETLVKISS